MEEKNKFVIYKSIAKRKPFIFLALACGVLFLSTTLSPEAGKNIANPIATVLSLSMALKYSLDLDKEAEQLDLAVQSVLDDGLRTKDIMSKNMKEVSTSDMGDAIIAKLK